MDLIMFLAGSIFMFDSWMCIGDNSSMLHRYLVQTMTIQASPTTFHDMLDLIENIKNSITSPTRVWPSFQSRPLRHQTTTIQTESQYEYESNLGITKSLELASKPSDKCGTSLVGLTLKLKNTASIYQ